MFAIKIENLTKEYKDVLAVDRLNLQIEQNQIFGLLGINGAGKTTTIKMLACLIKPTSGDAFVMGHSIAAESEKIKAIIGYSTQETAVAKNLTVKENLQFYGSLYNLNMQEIEERCERLINQFGLRKVVNKRVGKLSGGYQRKVSIALALISNPQILFLDEPTLGLDVIARRELWRVIGQIKKDCTIILTTHYLEEASALSDNIAIMVDGKLKAVDTPKNLIQKTNASNFEDAFIKIAGSEQYE